ncbi:MAG: T9SS type A sorting domain-containing protein [Chitinophagaceae bacterium]|nr:T9SS type A sorting domain-containing protein [Chitinophagaceae bacterium]
MICWLFIVPVKYGFSQSYQYAQFSGTIPAFPANAASGTGTFSSPAVIPDFNWQVITSSNKLNKLSFTLTSDEMPDPNAWESKYGNISTATSCLIARHGGNSSVAGAPLGIPITTTITFNSPAAGNGWGFMLLDVDVEQIDIEATDEFGNFYSNAAIHSWFRAVGDADVAADNAKPCWTPGSSTVVGSGAITSPCTRRTTLSSSLYEGVGAFAYFEPDVPVKSLIFHFYNLQDINLTSYRLFIAAQTLSVLPVGLLDFQALLLNDAVRLNWQTSKEGDVSSFVIEHSTDGLKFTPVGSVNAKGYNDHKSSYSWKHISPESGRNYYRLAIIDKDGQFTYSKTEVVQFQATSGSGNVYPNPARSVIHITLPASVMHPEVQLFNTLGTRIMFIKVSSPSKVLLSLASIPAGMYYVVVAEKNKLILREKIVKME